MPLTRYWHLSAAHLTIKVVDGKVVISDANGLHAFVMSAPEAEQLADALYEASDCATECEMGL